MFFAFYVYMFCVKAGESGGKPGGCEGGQTDRQTEPVYTADMLTYIIIIS